MFSYLIEFRLLPQTRHALLSTKRNTLTSGGSRISRREGVHPIGGHGPLKQAFFRENVCKNERIGSNTGVRPV